MPTIPAQRNAALTPYLFAVVRRLPPAVNDDFARRIKQAECTYRGARPAEYRLGLQSAVALCTLGRELHAPYRQGSPKFKAFETGWEDAMLAWLDLHPTAFYLAGSALP